MLRYNHDDFYRRLCPQERSGSIRGSIYIYPDYPIRLN